MAHFLNGKTIKDIIETKVLISKANLLSVNQLNAKIKLVEVWKALNIEDYPIKIMQQFAGNEKISTRAMTNGRLIEIGNSTLTMKTCFSDAIRLWNAAPIKIQNCISLYIKKLTKIYVKTLPI